MMTIIENAMKFEGEQIFNFDWCAGDVRGAGLASKEKATAPAAPAAPAADLVSFLVLLVLLLLLFDI